MLDLVAAFIALTTLLTYVNYRFIRLPPTIGVMATALVFSLIVQGLSELGYPILEVEMQEIIRRIDFSEVLMTWFLPALLFAGALHVDLPTCAATSGRSACWPPPGADRHLRHRWPGLLHLPRCSAGRWISSTACCSAR